MEPQSIERRLAAILAADVAGYSRLMGADEVGTLRRLQSHRRELIDPTIAEHHGRIVKTMGDGLLVEFASVVDAVECAVDVQRGMARRNADEPEARRIVLRIGVNLGDIIVEDGDIYGDGVNIAARLEGLAAPGGVCISRAARDQVRDKLSVGLVDMGEHEVKNIARPVRTFHVALEGVAAPALQAAEPPAPILPAKPSIVVLPFANMSGDKEQEYFVDGITEDIITELSRFRALFVIARNSAFAYKGQTLNLQQVGRDMGVRYVIEGSVRKAGNRLRISVQLADATSGEQLWAERFDRELEDVFALQDEITARVIGALPSRLEAADLEHARRKPTDNMEAYDCLLRGKDHHHRGTPEDNARALEMLDQALALDPEFAEAHAWKACTLGQAWGRGYKENSDEVLAQVLAAAETSRALEDDDCECHRVLSDVHIIRGDHERALAHHEKAFALNPNDPRIVSQRGELLTWIGRAEEGAAWIEKAMLLDPHSAERHAGNLATALHGAGRYDDAIAAFKRVAKRSAGHCASLAACCARVGRHDEAKAHAAEVLEQKPDFSIEAHVNSLPYMEEEDREHHREDLREAGLPE